MAIHGGHRGRRRSLRAFEIAPADRLTERGRDSLGWNMWLAAYQIDAPPGFGPDAGLSLDSVPLRIETADGELFGY